MLRLTLQILLPIAVLGGGAGAAYLIVSNTKDPVVMAPANPWPLVRTVAALPATERLTVTASGTVEPLRTVELAAEVSGRVVATHASLRAGGVFAAGDVLAKIDPTDFQLAIAQHESALARAELRLMREEAEAEAAVRAWRKLEGDRPADALVRREPQIKDARLAVKAAKAMLERARLDLARCAVQLPFAGRVRSVHADIGQIVQRGQRLAVTIDTSELEVRLPISLRDAGCVDLPLSASDEDGPEVTLTSDFAGEARAWPGRIVRIEGEIDRSTRQLTAIARVSDAGEPPLLVGMFVQAKIKGREAQGVFAVPRAAFVTRDELWVVEDRVDKAGEVSQRLTRRRVDVLRTERDRVLVRAGLRAGERVCLTSLQAPVEGMRVRAKGDVAAAEERAR